MKSLADGLPPEIAQQIHPDWRKNEADYWDGSRNLLEEYRNKWVGFANGRVIASGTSPVAVFHAAHRAIIRFVFALGAKMCRIRMRRATFTYDTDYDGEALPVLNVEFRVSSGVPDVLLEHVIADTGSDTTALPWADCRTLQLDPREGVPGTIHGVAGGVANTLRFFVWAYLDGKECACNLQADFTGTIVFWDGDVLNASTFCFAVRVAKSSSIRKCFDGPLRRLPIQWNQSFYRHCSRAPLPRGRFRMRSRGRGKWRGRRLLRPPRGTRTRGTGPRTSPWKNFRSSWPISIFAACAALSP